MTIQIHTFDAVIIGGGGAGLRASLQLAEAGVKVASHFAELDEFRSLAHRSQMVSSAVGSFPATKLKDFVYQVFPEIVNMQWGRQIEL